MRARGLVMTIVFTAAMLGCTPGSKFIRGFVVKQTPTYAHINLGSDDGIQVGDTLVVWREETTGALSRTVRAGIVRVVHVLDAGHAAVEVLKGNVRERDQVEKRIR